MNKVDLKACPFCGRSPRKTPAKDIVDGKGNFGFAVACSNLSCCLGPVRRSKKNAESAWNIRRTRDK